MILLDTDIIIDVLRNKKEAVEFFSVRQSEIHIIHPIMLELLAGARNRAEAELIQKKIDLSILEIDEGIWQRAREIIIEYGYSHGTGIIDSLIAATALEYDFELYSNNEKHYQPIAALRYKKAY
ncbi:MAG: PIN domain-containing protein [Spirochaetia bacterium]|nr:PIN domain-containing protein [Spirochaetia bacterium]